MHQVEITKPIGSNSLASFNQLIYNYKTILNNLKLFGYVVSLCYNLLLINHFPFLNMFVLTSGIQMNVTKRATLSSKLCLANSKTYLFSSTPYIFTAF